MDYLSEIRQFHKIHVERYTGQPIGCSKREIDQLEQEIGFPLPEAYRQYLAWMGHDYDGVFRGSDWFITHVKSNTDYLPKLLEENKVKYILPEKYFVFFRHQGYMSAWFELPKEGDNPQSFFFSEGTSAEPKIEGTFTDILFKDMRGLASFLPRVQPK